MNYRLPFRDDAKFSILMLIMLLVPVAFSLWTQESFETIKFFFLILLLGAELLVVARTRPWQFRYHRAFLVAGGLFWLWTLLATIFSLDRYNSIFGIHHRLTGSLILFSAWLLFGLFLVNSFTRAKYIFSLRLLNLVALAMAVLALLQNQGIAYYAGLNAEALPRVPSLLGNPNFSSMFIACLTPVAIFLWSQSTNRWRHALYGVNVVLLAWGVAVLGSRGAFFALIAGLFTAGVLVVRAKFPWRLLLYFGSTIIISALLFFVFFKVARPEALSPTVNFSESNISSRVFVWDTAARIIRSRPWFGSGLANFQIMFERMRGPESAVFDGVFDDAHNFFLQVAATGGIPLLMLFLTLLGIPLWSGLRALEREPDWLTAASISGVVTWAVAASFTPVVIACYLLLMIFLAGLVYSGARTFEPKRFVPLSRGLLVLAGLVLMVYATAFFSAEVIYVRAYSAYLTRNFALSNKLVNLAIKLNPFNEFYYLYRAGTETQLGFPQSQILADIEKSESFHPLEGRTARQAAGLYFLLFRHTGDPKYADQALASARKSSSIDPYFTERYQYLTYLTFQLGLFDETMKYVAANISLNQNDFQSWMILAKLYQVKGDRDAAISALSRALSLQPGIIQVKNMLHSAEQEQDIHKAHIDIILSDSDNLE